MLHGNTSLIIHDPYIVMLQRLLTLVCLNANLKIKIMNTLISFSKEIFIVFLFISPGYLLAQDENDLTWAVLYQDLDKVKQLIEAGADINYQEESAGATALIMAVQYNFADIARYLIEKGADLSIRTKTGHTALMAAAVSSEELFDLLVSKGADMSVKLENGTSAFTLSISGAMSDYVGLETAKKLLENGADVDEAAHSGPTEGYTCLIMAAGNQRPDIVKFLVDEGVNVNARAGDGITPLSMAEKRNDPEMVTLLKKLGAE